MSLTCVYVYIGAICGENTATSSLVSNSTAVMNIGLNYSQRNQYCYKYARIGGACGRNYGTLEDCSITGSIDVTNSGNTLSSMLGGAVAENATNGKITNIFVDVDITTGYAVNGSVGGIVGENAGGTSLLKSVYTGNVNITSGITNYGQLVAVNSGTVHNCYYSSGTVINVDGAEKTATLSLGTVETLGVIRTADFIYNKLFWKSDVWEITDGENPKLK